MLMTPSKIGALHPSDMASVAFMCQLSQLRRYIARRMVVEWSFLKLIEIRGLIHHGWLEME